MRKRPLLITLVGLGCILLAGTTWLGVQLGSLGALSLPPPLSGLISSEASACILLVSVDTPSADLAAIAKALQSYTTDNKFKLDHANAHASLGAYGSLSYEGPGTLTLLASTYSDQVTIQIFRRARDHANYTQQIRAAIIAFEGAGLRQMECK